MDTTRKLLVLLTTLLASFLLGVGPALASEGTHEKVSLPESQRDLVGLFLIGLVVLGSLAAFVNARRQLKGERDQATGEFRWR